MLVSAPANPRTLAGRLSTGGFDVRCEAAKKHEAYEREKAEGKIKDVKVETRSLPTLARPESFRGFTFYVAFPKSSIRPLGFPIYVARVPAAPFTRCYLAVPRLRDR